MQGNGKKIAELGQRAWEEFSALIHSFLSKAEVKEISLSFISVVHNFVFEATEVKIVDYNKQVQPEVKDFREEIISPEMVKVVLEKLKFSVLAQPLLSSPGVLDLKVIFFAVVKKTENIMLALKQPVSLAIPKREKAHLGLKDYLLSAEANVLEDMAYILKRPGIVQRTGFQKFSSMEIISFWNALMAKTLIEKENLELVGVYQPIPLHKVKKIQFDAVSGNLYVFFNQERKKSKLVRVIIGRNKNDRQKTFMVVMPL